MGETASVMAAQQVGVTSTIGPRGAKRIDEVIEHYNNQEKEMRNLLAEIIKSSKSNYRFKASTNSILIIIGAIIIATPVAFSWLSSINLIKVNMDLTNLNYYLGGIGVVAFVSTFFNKPQKQMTIATADLAQSLLICNMYHIQFEVITRKIRSMSLDNSALKDCLAELENITKNALQLIDRYLNMQEVMMLKVARTLAGCSRYSHRTRYKFYTFVIDLL